MELLKDKIAIVTGGGQGIGAGIARRFVEEGAKVAIAEIDQEHGTELAKQLDRRFPGRVLFIETDVSDKAQVERAIARTVEHFGGLDVLVNNAAAESPNVLLEAKTDAMLERTLGAGLWATWWFMRGALPHLITRGGGRIINFYSIDVDTAAWLHADYNATKAAIQALSRSAAVEWGRFNIQTNLIAPAAAGTVFEKLEREFPGFAAAAAANNPLGRVGDPYADIAPAAVFLASDLARYVNGVTLDVDGGQHLPRYQSRPDNLAEMDALTGHGEQS
ncbi:SDR family oxidoreductase [Pseudomonas sp. NBRC 100443]|uniref:SDR family NAD(P)-dependent oxidoreductase n=1 Tax=Pseudomonas sp. NBRC 100443 TaxID=1113665 RepID=UPI0024A2335D|nr:SDR family oxidoreductase [Pseudomonas sp. NBRC 100443]GLU37356.1 short-chain dehydrogenase [Pseudomonas sp. NBRC 100443]